MLSETGIIKRIACMSSNSTVVRGLLQFVPTTAHICLNLPATFSQPHTSIFGPSSEIWHIWMFGHVSESIENY